MTALLAVLNKQLEAECRMGNHRNLPWRGKQEARQMTVCRQLQHFAGKGGNEVK